MPLSNEQIKALSAKLDVSHVKSRNQSGRSLSYIEGWHAIAEANRIFGFDAWTRETIDVRCVNESKRKIGQTQRDGWGVSYIARVKIVACGIVREGTGAGHGIDVDLGIAHESAIKEAETDAMKRAMMTFGNPFGLALYDKDKANVGTPDEVETPAKIDLIPITTEIFTGNGTPKAANAIKKDEPERWGEIIESFQAAKTVDDLRFVGEQINQEVSAWPPIWRACLEDEYKERRDQIEQSKMRGAA